jgi:hypothetical protein
VHDWAEIEPIRWGQLRRAVKCLMWSFFLNVVSCAVVSVPLFIVGARTLEQWAPTHDVRRFARTLLVVGVLQVAALVSLIVAVAVRGHIDVSRPAFVLLFSIGAIISLLDLVGWIGTLRGLCKWAHATHIVAAWNRTIRFLPIAWFAVALSIVLAYTADLPIFVVGIASFWPFWLIGHPTWWTYRLFDADLRRTAVSTSHHRD